MPKQCIREEPGRLVELEFQYAVKKYIHMYDYALCYVGRLKDGMTSRIRGEFLIR